MKNIILSIEQHNLIERLYRADHVFTKSDFDDPESAKKLIQSLVEKKLVKWISIGNWEVTILESGRAYYQQYQQSLIDNQEKENYDNAVYRESKKSNSIQFWTLIVSILALLASIAVPFIVSYFEKKCG